MLLALICVAALSAGMPCAAVEKVVATGDAVTFTAANAEIVVRPGAEPVVRFAAKEAKTFLSEVLGADVPVVDAPTDGRASLVLGSNAWADGAGLSTNAMERDEFVIAARGSRVYVLGRDSATVDPEWVLLHGGWSSVLFERSTMFGVYDFLERFARVRFYFPGELGTIPNRNMTVGSRKQFVPRPDACHYSRHDERAAAVHRNIRAPAAIEGGVPVRDGFDDLFFLIRTQCSLFSCFSAACFRLQSRHAAFFIDPNRLIDCSCG